MLKAGQWESAALLSESARRRSKGVHGAKRYGSKILVGKRKFLAPSRKVDDCAG
jgi:hypothetical protein